MFFFFNCCVCILLRKYSFDKDIQSILVSKEGQSMLEVWEIRSSGEKFSTGFEQNNIQYTLFKKFIVQKTIAVFTLEDGELVRRVTRLTSFPS